MKQVWYILLSLSLLLGISTFTMATEAEDIVAEADKARSPGESFSFDLQITSTKPNSEDALSRFQVLVKCQFQYVHRQ